MAESDMMPRGTLDFYDQFQGKRVIIETLAMQAISQTSAQPERFVGVLEGVNPDGILIRPDNGRLVLVFKHAILSVSEAVPPGFTPHG